MARQDNLAFMRPLRDNSMQLIVTSPPYNIGKSYEVRSSLAAAPREIWGAEIDALKKAH